MTIDKLSTFRKINTTYCINYQEKRGIEWPKESIPHTKKSTLILWFIKQTVKKKSSLKRNHHFVNYNKTRRRMLKKKKKNDKAIIYKMMIIVLQYIGFPLSWTQPRT